MEEKTLILKVDLCCKSCCTKMKKILCKCQDEWDIKKITWDKKNDEITLVGCFDPEKLKLMLWCKACKIIKEFIIPKPPKPPEEQKPKPKPCCPPPKPCCPPPKPCCPPPEPCCPPPEPCCPPPEPCCPPPEPCCPPPKPKPCPPPKPKPCPPREPSPPPSPKPVPCPPVSLWVNGKICTYGPCHEKQRPCSCDCGSSGHRRCYCEDRCYDGCGYVCPTPPIYGRPTCQVICEDGTPGTCSIM